MTADGVAVCLSVMPNALWAGDTVDVIVCLAWQTGTGSLSSLLASYLGAHQLGYNLSAEEWDRNLEPRRGRILSCINDDAIPIHPSIDLVLNS